MVARVDAVRALAEGEAMRGLLVPGAIVFVPPNVDGVSEEEVELLRPDGAQGVFTGTVYADQRVEIEVLEGFVKCWPEKLVVMG